MSTYPDGVSVFENVVLNVSVFPIRAATSPPFQHTNLVILFRPKENVYVVVDPGGNDEAHLAKALSPIKAADVFVVITHKVSQSMKKTKKN